jgi:ankyrin repeat protein
MPSRKHPPTRTLRHQPDLAQLKRQAKELLKAFAAGDADAVAEVNTHYRGAHAPAFALHQAQLVLARSYGFATWPTLKAYVDGVTVRRLADAVRAGNLGAVRSMVAARPELVNLDLAEDDEHQALHHAVLHRRPEIVRFLMQHGADPRKGIYPHRNATSAITLAIERGYTDIAAIIRDEEKRRPSSSFAAMDARESAAVSAAVERDDEAAIIAALDAHPALVQASDPKGRTPLHWAAARLWRHVAAWLLDHGADAKASTNTGETPLDLVGDERESGSADTPRLVTTLAEMLLGRGAERTARWAVSTGDANWLRARHAEGGLTNHRRLVRHAVKSNRPDMLTLLLELGLDPDEAGRVSGLEEIVPTFGEPLRECAIAGQLAMAEILLDHGANPNTNVYAASSALHEAYSRHDAPMIALLERHGGRLTGVTVGILGLTAQAARMLADDAAAPIAAGTASPDSSVAQDLLWGAMEGPSPEIVRMALAHLDWPRDDPRWHRMLENALYLGPQSNRPLHLEGFRLTLDRSGPDVPAAWGGTLLHDIAASRGGLTASDRVAFAALVLDAGARLDIRDTLLRSTPLGWACRWGRIELVKLFLARGADPIEADAEPWATPKAWAEKMNRKDVLAELRTHEPSPS